MIVYFVTLQIVLLFFMLFHDWVSVRPLNDIAALKQHDTTKYRLIGSLVNGLFVAVPLGLTLLSTSAVPRVLIVVCYLLLTVGSVLSWWVPYFFGSSSKHKQHFRKFDNTHCFLPARGNNVVPNTLHVLLHLQIWACLAFSIGLLFKA